MRHTRYKPCRNCGSQEFRHVTIKKIVAIWTTGSVGHGSDAVLMEAFECNKCGKHIATTGLEPELQEEVEVTYLGGGLSRIHYDRPKENGNQR